METFEEKMKRIESEPSVSKRYDILTGKDDPEHQNIVTELKSWHGRYLRRLYWVDVLGTSLYKFLSVLLLILTITIISALIKWSYATLFN